MIISKVIRDNRRHISRADYHDIKPTLSLENVTFPKVSSLQARSFRRFFPAGVMLSHREFDFVSSSYRLGSFVDRLREKGWTIVCKTACKTFQGPGEKSVEKFPPQVVQ